ncbi:MAG: acyl-CoA dehydratase activase [Planctomycetales bacterium]|nr:acyl-CoA dehydratase activase [Planctomycetales bacterium]
MRAVCGIDLGSTTTKALLLDETGAVAGRGITNTRSNYFVATAVARAEALLDARLGRLRAALATAGDGEAAGTAAAALEEEVRFRQHEARLEDLLATCEEEAVRRHPDAVPELRRIAGAMRAGSRAAHDRAKGDRSRFFRDLAGGEFLRLAEEAAAAGRARFETLMSLSDRSMLAVENRVPEGDIAALVRDASRALRARGGLPPRTAEAVEGAAHAAAEEPVEVLYTVGTGYGRQRLPFAKEQIRSEILCHGLGAHALFPDTRTVLDIGGQDTKAIQVDGDGVVTAFQMNDRCAAGCGRYLGYVADELSLSLPEIGPLALRAARPARITSTCTVFAGAELRERLSLGESREAILAGLHRAIVLRAMSLLARAGGVRDQFTFTGGVAKNPAVVRALRDLTDRHYGAGVTLNVHPDSIYTGALGAALFARRAAEQGLRSAEPGPAPAAVPSAEGVA